MIRSIKIYTRLGLRYISRNRDNIIMKSIEVIDENISSDIMSYMKYKIVDNTYDSYLYIILYELIYLSILLKIKDNEEHKELIDTSIQSIIVYIIINKLMNL